MNETETYFQARDRLALNVLHSMLDLALRQCAQHGGQPAAEDLAQALSAGAAHLEFAVRIDAASCNIVGMRCNPAGAFGVVDAVLHGAPGEPFLVFNRRQ